MTTERSTIEISCGTIEYVERGSSEKAFVFLHGLTMDHRVWDAVIDILCAEYRCIAPTLPEGGHRIPTRPEFILSPDSVADLIGEFVGALGLHHPILIENDSGRAQQFAGRNPDRLGGLVIASCETAGNFPPGLAGKLAVAGAKVPGAVWLQAQALRFKVLRHSSLAYGLMAHRPLPDDLLRSWLEPLQSSHTIRRDFVRYLKAVRGDEMEVAAIGLRNLECPALVVWGEEDRFMPIATGRQLAELIPTARFLSIPESGTLIPLDQPERLAEQIDGFARSIA